MNEPKRLIEGDDLGAKILSSARNDFPGDKARRSTAVALGIVAGGSLGAGGAAAAGKLDGSFWLSGLTMKVLGAGLLAAAVGTAAWKALSPGPQAPVAAVESKKLDVPVGEIQTAIAVAEKMDETPQIKAKDESSVSPVVPVGKLPKPVVAVKAASPSEPSVLPGELDLLDEAKSAMNRWDHLAADSALARYDRLYPAGALAPEARVLRVEAFVRWGEKQKARALANELLAKDPDGPQSKRLKSLLQAVQE